MLNKASAYRRSDLSLALLDLFERVGVEAVESLELDGDDVATVLGTHYSTRENERGHVIGTYGAQR